MVDNDGLRQRVSLKHAVTRRDAVTVNDPAGDALSGPIVCWVAAAPGHRRVTAY